MQLTGVHHVSINVPAVDEALSFYVDVLGLSARTDRPDFGFGGAWLDAGDQQIHLLEGQVPSGHGQHFALQVADLDDAVGSLRAQGVKISDPSVVGKGRQAFLEDPGGNLVELYQGP